MKKINLKKRKLKFKIRYVFLLIIFYLAFAGTYFLFMKNSNLINNENFINLLLSEGNHNILYENKTSRIVNSTIKYLTNIDLTKPNTILNYSILKFGEESEEEIIVSSEEDNYNILELEKISSYIKDPNPVDIEKPIVYIYNTHQLENYNAKNLEIYNITPNVMMASFLLREKLNDLGVSTIVEDTNLTEFLKINNWDYASSYKASRLLILDKKNKYDSLTYYIDLHRDSVSKNVTTATIDGKNYAKIMFVVGLEHENYNANLEIATKLNNLLKEKYPSLSRGIYKKSGPGVDGVYNQDISSNSILIEVGGVDNTIEEVLNTIEAFSLVFLEFVSGEINE